MSDSEFTLEVTRDYFDEMRDYTVRALAQKKIKTRHASDYKSKRGNSWHIIYRPEDGGQCGLHIKRVQPNAWFTWYSLIFGPNRITLFGFNKHVAERISLRYHSQLSPSEALKEMLLKTPAIIQGELEDQFYTRVNGGVCIGSVYGKRYPIKLGSFDIVVELRETKTFISDEQLFNDQKQVTDESIVKAINSLGKSYLSDHDLQNPSEN